MNALRENADDFLTKPLNLLQLKTTLSKALDKKRLKEELVYLRRMDSLKNGYQEYRQLLRHAPGHCRPIDRGMEWCAKYGYGR